MKALPSDPSIATPHTIIRVHYGKYYSYDGYGQRSDEAGFYYVFLPANASVGPLAPMVVEFHGGGFTGGAATRALTAKINACLQNGIAWISVDYRLVATQYYYDDPSGSSTEEELIHASADGRLTLDAKLPLSSYHVRIGRQEFNTKCSYDAGRALEDLLSRAHILRLDPHRIAFTGGSAGGGEMHYLSWVYRRLDQNWRR